MKWGAVLLILIVVGLGLFALYTVSVGFQSFISITKTLRSGGLAYSSLNNLMVLLAAVFIIIIMIIIILILVILFLITMSLNGW